MSEPITNSEASSVETELSQMEQAITEQAGSTESTNSEESATSQDAPEPQYGEAFAALAEKKGFRSPDDLVRSYQQLESYKTQLEQDRKELLSSVKQNAPTDKSTEELPPQQREALGLLENVVEKVISKRMAPLQESLEVQKAKEEIAAVQGKHPDFTGYAVESAIQMVQKNPSLSLEDAHKILNYESRASEVRTQQNRTAKSAEKTKAYTESAGKAKTGNDLDYSKLSLEEMESIIPNAGQFIDSKGTLRR